MADVIVRPNGKPYRPRGPLRVVEYSNDYIAEGRAVLGTHSVDEAFKAIGGREFFALELSAESHSLDWWRVVPWDTGTGYDSNWITDEVRGTPCVVFG